MIKVPFTAAVHEVKESNSISHFLQRYQGMPWLTYLIENATKIESVKHYHPVTHQYVVDFLFHLDPKKETYYYLKFSS
jgi:hypothetical protein